jgi:hypothetical protein
MIFTEAADSYIRRSLNCFAIEAFMLFNKKKNSTPLEQFHNPLVKSYKEAKSIPLTHKFITAHFLGLLQALQ